MTRHLRAPLLAVTLLLTAVAVSSVERDDVVPMGVLGPAPQVRPHAALLSRHAPAPRGDGGRDHSAQAAGLVLRHFAPRSTPGSAFERRLRAGSLRFMDVHPWANPTVEMMEDDGVIDARSRAARGLLRQAASAAAGVAIGRNDGPGRAEERLAATGRYSGISLDTTPAWTARWRLASSRVRLDVPLLDDALRLQWSRDLRGGLGALERVGARLAVDPWDDEVRLVFSLGW